MYYIYSVRKQFLNCNNILQYYSFYSLFIQINAVLFNIRDSKTLQKSIDPKPNEFIDIYMYVVIYVVYINYKDRNCMITMNSLGLYKIVDF